MLDCGVHMGFQDMRKYPDFKAIGENFDKEIDLVIISHFHLDHCAALPYFTEMLG
jgi:integrator complex subunit 11